MKRQDLDAALDKALGADVVARQREALVKAAALPNDGGGPDTLAQILLGRGSHDEPALTARYDKVRALLVEWQEPDGVWHPAGQLGGLKWGPNESDHATTMWGALALSGTGG